MAEKYITTETAAPISTNRVGLRVKYEDTETAAQEAKIKNLQAQNEVTNSILKSTVDYFQVIKDGENYIKKQDAQQTIANYKMTMDEMQADKDWIARSLNPDGMTENEERMKKLNTEYKMRLDAIGMNKKTAFQSNQDLQTTWGTVQNTFKTKQAEYKITQLIKGVETNGDRISANIVDSTKSYSNAEVMENIDERVRLGQDRPTLEARYAIDLQSRLNDSITRGKASIETLMSKPDTEQWEIDNAIKKLKIDMENSQAYKAISNEDIFGENASKYKTALDDTFKEENNKYIKEMDNKKIDRFKPATYVFKATKNKMSRVNKTLQNSASIPKPANTTNRLNAATGLDLTTADYGVHATSFYGDRVNVSLYNDEYTYFGSDADEEKAIKDFDANTATMTTNQKLTAAEGVGGGFAQAYSNAHSLGRVESYGQKKQREKNLDLKDTYQFEDVVMNDTISNLFAQTTAGEGNLQIDNTDTENPRLRVQVNGKEWQLTPGQLANEWQNWKYGQATIGGTMRDINGGTITEFQDHLKSKNSFSYKDLDYDVNSKYIAAEPIPKNTMKYSKRAAVYDQLKNDKGVALIMQSAGMDPNNAIPTVVDDTKWDTLKEIIHNPVSKNFFNNKNGLTYTDAKKLFTKLDEEVKSEQNYVMQQKEDLIKDIQTDNPDGDLKKQLGGKDPKTVSHSDLLLANYKLGQDRLVREKLNYNESSKKETTGSSVTTTPVGEPTTGTTIPTPTEVAELTEPEQTTTRTTPAKEATETAKETYDFYKKWFTDGNRPDFTDPEFVKDLNTRGGGLIEIVSTKKTNMSRLKQGLIPAVIGLGGYLYDTSSTLYNASNNIQAQTNIARQLAGITGQADRVLPPMTKLRAFKEAVTELPFISTVLKAKAGTAVGGLAATSSYLVAGTHEKEVTKLNTIDKINELNTKGVTLDQNGNTVRQFGWEPEQTKQIYYAIALKRKFEAEKLMNPFEKMIANFDTWDESGYYDLTNGLALGKYTGVSLTSEGGNAGFITMDLMRAKTQEIIDDEDNSMGSKRVGETDEERFDRILIDHSYNELEKEMLSSLKSGVAFYSRMTGTADGELDLSFKEYMQKANVLIAEEEENAKNIAENTPYIAGPPRDDLPFAERLDYNTGLGDIGDKTIMENLEDLDKHTGLDAFKTPFIDEEKTETTQTTETTNTTETDNGADYGTPFPENEAMAILDAPITNSGVTRKEGESLQDYLTNISVALTGQPGGIMVMENGEIQFRDDVWDLVGGTNE